MGTSMIFYFFIETSIIISLLNDTNPRKLRSLAAVSEIALKPHSVSCVWMRVIKLIRAAIIQLDILFIVGVFLLNSGLIKREPITRSALPFFIGSIKFVCVNAMGTVALLEACRQVDTGRILVMNTDKVHGEGLDVASCVGRCVSMN